MALLEELQDDFEEPFDWDVRWPNSFGAPLNEDGRLRVPCTDSWHAACSDADWTLEDSYAFVQVWAPEAGGATTEAWAQFLVQTVTTTPVDVGFEIDALNGDLKIFNRVDYFDPTQTTLTYDPVDHHWLRVREEDGTVYWDTSPDGIDWTNRKTDTSPAWVGNADLELVMICHRDSGTNDFAYYDNVNIPQAVEPIPVPITAGMAGVGSAVWPSTRLQSFGVGAVGAPALTFSRSFVQTITSLAAGTPAWNRSVEYDRSFQGSAEGTPSQEKTAELHRGFTQTAEGSPSVNWLRVFSVAATGLFSGTPNTARMADLSRQYSTLAVGNPGIYKWFARTATSVASGNPFLYAQKALMVVVVALMAAASSVGVMRVVLRQFISALWGSPGVYKGFQVTQMASMAAVGSLTWLLSWSQEVVASLTGSPRLLRGLSQQVNALMAGSSRHSIGQFREFVSSAAGVGFVVFEGVVARLFRAIASSTPTLGSRLGKRLVASLTASGSYLRSLSANRSYSASAAGTARVQRGFWQTVVSSLSGLPFGDRGNNLVFQVVASGLAVVRRNYLREYLAQLEASPAAHWLRGILLSVVAELLPTTNQLLMKTILVVGSGVPTVLMEGFSQVFITLIAGIVGSPRVTRALTEVLVTYLAAAPRVVRDFLRSFSVGLQGQATLIKQLWKSFLAVAAGDPVFSRVLERVSVSVSRPARCRPKIRVVVYRKGTPLPQDESWSSSGFGVKWSSTAFDVGSSSGALDIGWSGELV